MVHYYGDYYYDDDRLQVILDVAIAGIVVVSLVLLVLIVGCIHASRVMRRLAATSSSSAEKGLSTVVVQGTGPDGQSLVHPQQIQAQGPFFMTSHRTPDGEEMVMVPRRLLAQFQQQQQQQQQSEYQLPPVVPPKSTTYLPQGLQRGDKAQIEEEQQQQQPNLNHATVYSQPTNEPAAMTQRKFDKSVKVEQDDDGGAGVGSGSDDVVAVVDERPSSSSSEKKGEIEEIKASA